MMAMRFLRVFALLSLLANASSKDEDQCGLFLTISSTSTEDHTVWGIYAGKDYDKGAVIGYPELAVNTINLRANNLMDENTPEEIQEPLIRSLEYLEESFWVPDAAGGKFEIEQGRIITAICGVGFLGAFDAKLTNADWNHKTSYQRPRLGEETGAPYPGRGAISPFYDVTLSSTDTIKAGSEVFVNYGTNWEEKEMKNELLRTDYVRIDETVEQMIDFFAKHKKELDAESKREIYKFITKDVMNAAVGLKKARKVSSILPPNPDDLPKVKKAGGTLAFSQPDAFRSVEWLREHALCMDNVRAGASTIPNAGRGAFATRRIKKGGLVTPVPLLQIPAAAVFNMHDVYLAEDGEYERASNDVTGQQLMLNYCYGHPQSTMLFFPTGSGAGLINHSDKPNAKLVWSKHPSNHKVWFELDPHELLDDENSFLGLMMEVVATRDIKEGEEIFIDYGPEWKAAWKKHVENWNKRVEKGEIPKEWPKRAVDMNEEYRTKPYRIESELKKDPYPENVGLTTFLMVAETENEGTFQDPKQWSTPAEGTVFSAENLFEPVIVKSFKIDDDLAAPYNYTVRWTNSKGEATYVKDVPHEAFVFVDEPETGDQFVENPFRHYIGIPDDIFPKGPWRNAA